MPHYTRTDSTFMSRGLSCEGWLYLPSGKRQPPVVIMGHGFAAEKTFGLAPFAERFLERGMAVFMFDYRNFGGSEGEPRNLVSARPSKVATKSMTIDRTAKSVLCRRKGAPHSAHRQVTMS